MVPLAGTATEVPRAVESVRPRERTPLGATAPGGITDPGYNDQAQFDRLQEKLVPLWKSIECFNQDPQTIVVVPSLSVDMAGAGAVVQAYEERFLLLLLLLRQPRARLIYVTSQTILPSIIDYYLDLLPGVIPSHARPRLFLLSPLDASVRPTARAATPDRTNTLPNFGSRSHPPCSV